LERAGGKGLRSPGVPACWGRGGASYCKIKRRFVGKFFVIIKKFMRSISWLVEEKLVYCGWAESMYFEKSLSPVLVSEST
jgi:hypothetical protein